MVETFGKFKVCYRYIRAMDSFADAVLNDILISEQ